MTQSDRNDLERRLKIIIDLLQIAITTNKEDYLTYLIDKSTFDLQSIQIGLKIIKNKS